jgi:TRAP-type mannitol/chloroaromatic compound transport system substrate-binding protein
VDLRKNKPRALLTRKPFYYYPYWWEAGKKKQRIEFLVKLIAQNEQKSAVNMMTIMAFCAVAAACLIGILAVCLL